MLDRCRDDRELGAAEIFIQTMCKVQYLDNMMQVIVIIAQLYIVRTAMATRFPIPVRCFSVRRESAIKWHYKMIRI